MLKLNLYSKNKGHHNDVQSEVTGHDRFGHIGVHRSAKSSSFANSFTPSPKWRIQKEALLRQQRQAERWRRASGVRGDGYKPIISQQPSTAAIKEENECNHSSESEIKSNSRSNTDSTGTQESTTISDPYKCFFLSRWGVTELFQLRIRTHT